MVTMRKGNGFARLISAVVVVAGVVATSAMPVSAAAGWSVVPSASPQGPPLGELSAVSCSSSADCFAIGSTDAGPLIEHWNGASWSIAPGPASGAGPSADLVSLSCPGPASCFAVGGSVIETLSTFTATPLVLHWDGTSWSAAKIPSPTGAKVAAFSGVSCTSPVNCFAVGASSDSSSASAPFTGMPFVDLWDGTSWSMVTAPSPTSAIEAELIGVSCPSAGDCFAVGDFETPAIGGALIEHWDGSRWSIIANAGTNASLSAGRRRQMSDFRRVTSRATSRAKPNQIGGLLSTPGLESVSCAGDVSCMAVGFSFNGALAEQWDGARWSIVATPTPPSTDGAELNGVSCSSSTDCSAVGDAGAESGSGLVIEVQPEPLSEHWNGASWTIEAQPKGSAVDALVDVACPTSTTCFSVGDSAFVQQWNGSVWSISPFSSKTSQSQLNEVSCSSAHDCFAVGTFVAGLRTSTLIEHWNGSSWSIVPSPTPSGSFATRLSGISCPSATSCTAVGFNEAITAETVFIEHWNGKAWSVVNGANPKGAELAQLSGVSCPSPTSCTAVGVQFGLTSAKVLIEHWNGKVWSVVAGPSSGAEVSQLESVSCPNASTCTAVGDSESFQGTRTPGARTLVEHWDGTTWTVTPSPNPTGAPFAALISVSCADATSCDAVGIDAKTILSPNKTLAEHWDGTTWTIAAVPAPAGATAGQLNSVSCRSASSCDAVGFVTTAATTKTLAEHWTGAHWSIVPSAEPSGASSASLGGVSCPSASSCLAVGTYNASDSFFTLAERGP